VLSASEQTRLDNIARNNTFLAQLNILDVSISNTNQFNTAAPRKHQSDDSDSDYLEEEGEKEEEEEE
jgi:hypothetical protein